MLTGPMVLMTLHPSELRMVRTLEGFPSPHLTTEQTLNRLENKKRRTWRSSFLPATGAVTLCVFLSLTGVFLRPLSLIP